MKGYDFNSLRRSKRKIREERSGESKVGIGVAGGEWRKKERYSDRENMYKVESIIYYTI